MRAAASVVLVAALACHPAGPVPEPSRAATPSDTLRGTFVLEGTDPQPMPVLRTASGRIVLDSVAPNLLKLSQLELLVRGSFMPRGHFRVSDFLVRGSGGQPAFDGVLARTGDGFALTLPGVPAHILRGAPPSFAQLVGKRIWVTETSAGTIADYGVI